MAQYRLSHTAQDDIVSILAWTGEQFGEEARKRYEVLIATAMRDASPSEGVGHTPRPELGGGAFSWHLSSRRTHAPGRGVRRPRHFLICRRDGDLLVVGRLLHDAMDLRRDIDPGQSWE